MIAIRPGTLDDIPALVRMNADVQRHHVDAEPAYYREPDPIAVAIWLRKALESHECLIAEVDGEPAGYVFFADVTREGSTFAYGRRFLSVDQIGASRRREGVGRALLDAVHAIAAERDIDSVELEVRAVNDGAISFYRALGYLPVKLRMARRAR